MITCFIKYQLNPIKLAEFKKYADIWIGLVKKYDGIHHGYFLPDDDIDEMLNQKLSFTSGKSGDKNTAMAFFSFANTKTYENYRELVKDDPQFQEATQLANH